MRHQLPELPKISQVFVSSLKPVAFTKRNSNPASPVYIMLDILSEFENRICQNNRIYRRSETFLSEQSTDDDLPDQNHLKRPALTLSQRLPRNFIIDITIVFGMSFNFYRQKICKVLIPLLFNQPRNFSFCFFFF